MNERELAVFMKQTIYRTFFFFGKLSFSCKTKMDNETQVEVLLMVDKCKIQ